MPTKFTKVTVANMVCPSDKSEAFFWDEDMPGFGIRAYNKGRRVWFVQYRTSDARTRRQVLADVRALDPEQARAIAKETLAKVALGADPQAEAKAQKAAETVLELIEAYLPKAEAKCGVRTYAEIKRALMVGAKALHPMKANKVGRREIVAALDDITARSGGVAANRARSYLSAMWSWALKAGQIEGHNPVANTPRPVEEKPRERVLNDAELALIWRCTAGGGDYHRAIRLLMLTAARLAEVGGMAWAEIDVQPDATTGQWTLPGERTKNGLPHELPLSALAVDQLPARPAKGVMVFGAGKNGFSGWSKSKERLDGKIVEMMKKDFEKNHQRPAEEDEVRLIPWRHHDLRRTFSTWANENGIEPHVVEAALNHASGASRAGVAGVYNKAQYRLPKRAALTAWESHVRAVCDLPPLADNVTQLKKVAQATQIQATNTLAQSHISSTLESAQDITS